MKHGVAIFPFNEEILPIVRHMGDFDVAYAISRLIAYKGDGLDKKDAAYVCNQPPIGIEVTDCLVPNEDSWEVLLIDVAALEKRNMQNRCLGVLEECLKNGKRLFFVGSDDQSMQDKFSQLHTSYPDAIHFITSDKDPIHKRSAHTTYTPVPVPVILVGGMVKQCDTLEILCALRKNFTKDGRVVSCICESTMGFLLGMHSYSHIFKDGKATEADKIAQINELVNNIIRAERPECIIIEAPDAVVKYSNLVPNGFCVRTYMVKEAVAPTMFIYSIPANFANEELIERMSDGFQKKYGFNISAVHASNILIDAGTTAQSENISFVYADTLISSRPWLEKRRIPVFNVVEKGGEALYQYIASLF